MLYVITQCTYNLHIIILLFVEFILCYGGKVVKKLSAKPRGERDAGSIPGGGKVPWRKKWQCIAVFLPRKSHGQRSLVGCSSWGCKVQLD